MTSYSANNTDYPVLSGEVQKRNRPSFIPASGKKTTEVPETSFTLPSPSNGLLINHRKSNPVVIKNGMMNDVNSGIKHQLPVPKPKMEPSLKQEDDGFQVVKKGPSGKNDGTPLKAIKKASIMELPLDKGKTSVKIAHKYTEKPQTTKSMKKNQKRRAKKASA